MRSERVITKDEDPKNTKFSLSKTCFVIVVFFVTS
jgi:hypothetical protein